jgi:hypothetical protein
MTSIGDFGMSLKVTTKKNLIIFHNPDEWAQVLDRLAEDFGQTNGLTKFCCLECWQKI